MSEIQRFGALQSFPGQGARIVVPDPGNAWVYSLYWGWDPAARNPVALNGTMVSGTKTITALGSSAGITPGMAVSGTSVGAGAVVVSVDSASQVTVSVPSTGSTTNAVTFSSFEGLPLVAPGTFKGRVYVVQGVLDRDIDVNESIADVTGFEKLLFAASCTSLGPFRRDLAFPVAEGSISSGGGSLTVVQTIGRSASSIDSFRAILNVSGAVSPRYLRTG